MNKSAITYPETANPLRILHVVISMTVGGAERLVDDMVRYPGFSAAQPVVCCLESPGELGEKLRRDGYTVYAKGRRSGWDFSIIPWLREIILRENITVVHAHQYTPLFYAVPATLLAGRVKVVYTEHGRFYPDRKSWKRRLFNPLLALGVDHLTAISTATAEAMAQYDNLPRGRIQVIHNGIDSSRLNPLIDKAAKRGELGLSQTCRIIGTAARLNEIKNIPMMLRVLKLVLATETDTMLVIAGQGEEEARLKALASQLEIADRVKFIGLRFDLAEVYQLFDVFLLTSFSEGISITLLEAMASGVPAVVTDVGGNRETVVEGETGYLVPTDADGLMAEWVTVLLQEPQIAARLGQAGRERGGGEFSGQRMMERYLQLYY